MPNKRISELPYIPGSQISGNTLVPLVTYYSAVTGTTVHTYVDDFQNYVNNNGYWVSGSTGVGSVTVNNGGGSDSQGNYSYSEGQSNTAVGDNSHAEGNGTTANGQTSHSEGRATQSNGSYSHAEGNSTTAQGNQSHSEGYFTVANGDSSHAQNEYTEARGNFTHAGGKGYNSTYVVSAFGSTTFVHSEATTTASVIAYADNSSILGGKDHIIYQSSNNSTVVGGANNIIGTGSTSSTIIGGTGNTISDNVSNTTILGGANITASSSNTVYVPTLRIGTVNSGVVATNLAVDSTGRLISGRTDNFKVYSALLTQSSTSAPSATILQNTLGYTPSLTYGVTGSYQVKISASTSNLYYNITTNSSNVNYDFRVTTSFSMGLYDIAVFTYSGSSLTNGLLNSTPIEIRIYD